MDFDKYLAKTLKFLSYRIRSEKEILDFLNKHNASKEKQEKIIHFLKEQKFVNDEEFARQWIESRLRSRPKALRVIKLELKQKGIAEEIIEKIQNSEFRVQNDLESAKKLVEKKIERYRHLSKEEIYQKLGGFLARRGFDWETIKAAINSSLK